MTREGYDNLKTELLTLEARRPDILRAIKEAREKGDLSENAEYHAAREDLGMVEAKIEQIRGKLALAEIIEGKRAPKGVVVFGSAVRVFNKTFDEEEQYHLVGEGEADPRNNRILTTSPVGQALLSRKVGDEVEVPIPQGTMKLKILEITH